MSYISRTGVSSTGSPSPKGVGVSKGAIAQLLGATVFQFYVSIVDPSILAQPTAPGSPAIAPGVISAAPGAAAPQKLPTVKDSQDNQGQLTGTAGALQRGATQPLPTQ
jgi:hypothetical protein